MDRIDMTLRFKEGGRESHGVDDMNDQATLPKSAAKHVPTGQPNGIGHTDIHSPTPEQLEQRLEQKAHDVSKARADVAFLVSAQEHLPWDISSKSAQSLICHQLKSMMTQNLVLQMDSELKALLSTKEALLRNLPPWIGVHLFQQMKTDAAPSTFAYQPAHNRNCYDLKEHRPGFHGSAHQPTHPSYPPKLETTRAPAQFIPSEVKYDAASGINVMDAQYGCRFSVSMAMPLAYDCPTAQKSWRSSDVHTSCPVCKSNNILAGHSGNFSYCAECSRPIGIAERPFTAAQAQQELPCPSLPLNMCEQDEESQTRFVTSPPKACEKQHEKSVPPYMASDLKAAHKGFSEYYEQRGQTSQDTGFHGAYDYEEQLAILEEQNRKRLMMQRSKDNPYQAYGTLASGDCRTQSATLEEQNRLMSEKRWLMQEKHKKMMMANQIRCMQETQNRMMLEEQNRKKRDGAFAYGDYRTQLAILEEQNRKRLMKQSCKDDRPKMDLKHFLVPDAEFGNTRAKRPASASEALGKNNLRDEDRWTDNLPADYEMQLKLLEMQNKKRVSHAKQAKDEQSVNSQPNARYSEEDWRRICGELKGQQSSSLRGTQNTPLSPKQEGSIKPEAVEPGLLDEHIKDGLSEEQEQQDLVEALATACHPDGDSVGSEDESPSPVEVEQSEGSSGEDEWIMAD